ncbi:MAG: enoyl-CoA hydratase/isomerase family protein [Chloroflexi bacterium]|nr:enoyl-CoA hydratase/isomerase family protein [Chloroflexota bacterium]
MDFTTIILKKEAGIATMTLNRPQRLNAVNPVVHREMLQGLMDVKNDSSVRVFVLTGAGRGFCAGGDFKGDKDSLIKGEEWLKPNQFLNLYRSQIQPFIMGLQALDIPTIAMVNGPAFGVGFDFALACDMRVGSPNARFCAAWTRRAITTAGGTTWLLPRVVGVPKAAELIFFAREVKAEEAERLGILNKLVPAEKLEEETMAWASELAKGPPIALKLSKMNLYRGLELDLPAALDLLCTSQGIALTTEDHKESVRAFREKREAIFRGE